MRILLSAPKNGDTAGHRKRLFDMQVPFLSVLPHSSVVIYSVRHIGILLDLRDQDPFPDGMQGPGFNKQHISLAHRHCIEHFQERVFPDPPGEFLPCDLFPEAIIKKCPFFRIEDIPHFCLAVLSLILKREGIPRVDLNRKTVPGVNEFCEDWKFPESSAVRAEHLHPLAVQILLQGLSRMTSVPDHRRSVRMT